MEVLQLTLISLIPRVVNKKFESWYLKFPFLKYPENLNTS